MDAAFLGLTKTTDPDVWALAVTDKLTGGRGQLFGGCVLGAAAGVLEQVTARTVAWATCQFLAGARPGDTSTLRTRW